jgi:hypothetical protein
LKGALDAANAKKQAKELEKQIKRAARERERGEER